MKTQKLYCLGIILLVIGNISCTALNNKKCKKKSQSANSKVCRKTNQEESKEQSNQAEYTLDPKGYNQYEGSENFDVIHREVAPPGGKSGLRETTNKDRKDIHNDVMKDFDKKFEKGGFSSPTGKTLAGKQRQGAKFRLDSQGDFKDNMNQDKVNLQIQKNEPRGEQSTTVAKVIAPKHFAEANPTLIREALEKSLKDGVEIHFDHQGKTNEIVPSGRSRKRDRIMKFFAKFKSAIAKRVNS